MKLKFINSSQVIKTENKPSVIILLDTVITVKLTICMECTDNRQLTKTHGSIQHLRGPGTMYSPPCNVHSQLLVDTYYL